MLGIWVLTSTLMEDDKEFLQTRADDNQPWVITNIHSTLLSVFNTNFKDQKLWGDPYALLICYPASPSFWMKMSDKDMRELRM